MSDPIKELSESGWIAEHRKLYLENGVAGHMWDSTVGGGPGPLPTLLLFTTGRKSGQESIMPLLYDKVESGYAIIASKGGFPTHPGWWWGDGAGNHKQYLVGGSRIPGILLPDPEKNYHRQQTPQGGGRGQRGRIHEHLP